MVSIELNDVCIDFPIYDADRSFRKMLLRRRTEGAFVPAGKTGGVFAQSGTHRGRVVVSALQGITFALKEGDRLGLIGHNGAGKTTLLRTIAGVYEPVRGEISVEGTISPMFSITLGMDLDNTGRRNIRACAMFLGMTAAQIDERLPEIEEFTELGDYLSLPMRTYSAGMQTRLAFAIATASDPGILLLDEGLSAGDARFADKAKKRVDRLIERSSLLVIATHSNETIRSMCNKAVHLCEGRIVEFGDVGPVIRSYEQYVAQTS
jgi:ABC-type polysaccharide/polyol phosphate transport system ATPase subunit